MSESDLTSSKFDIQLLSNYRLVSSSPAQLLHANYPDKNELIEIRLLPWMDSPEKVTRLQDQASLASLVLGVKSKAFLNIQTETQPPKVYSVVPAKTVSHYLPGATPFDRVELAQKILRTVDQALLGNLYHGNLSVDCIFIDGARLFIDYLARFYEPDKIDNELSDQADLVQAHEVVCDLMKPLLDNQEIIDTGMRRAQLNSLIQRDIYQAGEYQTFDQWIELLDGLAKKKNENLTTANIVAELEELTENTEEIYQDDLIDGATAELMVNEDQTEEVDLVTANTIPNQLKAPKPGDRLGRFELGSRVGQGGMGVVFSGIDLVSNRPVAVKILRPQGQNLQQAIRRFRKEATLLQSIQNDYVTKLLDFGFSKGMHYLAMEFVEGTNLSEWMSSRSGVDENEALGCIVDVAKALADAHESEIIHRDIKPENILLGAPGATKEIAHSRNLKDFKVKLSDFGIARAINQTASMEMTRAGAMLGTPSYMSPEQCKGTDEIVPASDVYSLGITLFQLLTGQLPFRSDDAMKLAAMHCFDPVPDIRKLNAKVSDATFDLLNRMLAKKSADRPADAKQLISEIEKLQRGEPAAFHNHPVVPEETKKVWKREWEWKLQSSASELWPHVSNTDRLNRAAGLHAVEYRTVKDEKLGIRRFGSFKLMGMKIEWEEHPFEWIEGRRMGILREFSRGPFKWFLSVVELNPQSDGTTLLKHMIRIEPRSSAGRIVATIEAGWKGGRSLDRVYRRIDQSIQKEKQNPLFDPFEPVQPPKSGVLKRIEQRMEKMLDDGISIDIANSLCEYLQVASPQALAQIRPLALADTLQVDRDQLLDACLVAVRNGLLKLRWDILCPTCRAPAGHETLLSNIKNHTGCEACDTEFESNIANAIEMVFQAHPEIRSVDDGQYCIGGPAHSPHVVAQIRMQPNEKVEVSVPVTAGDYVIRGPRIGTQVVRVQPRSAPSSLRIQTSQIGDSVGYHSVRAGNLNLVIDNDLESVESLRMERTLQRDNVVTAAVASTMSRFRELFPEQVFDRENAVASDEVSLVAVRIASSDLIYNQFNDREGFQIISNLMDSIQNSIGHWNGSVINSMGEMIVASFQDKSQAVMAAKEIEQRVPVAAESETVRKELQLAIAIHCGPLLVTTQNGRLDYFGKTVRQLQALCESIEQGIALTDIVFSDPGVQQVLEDFDSTPEHLNLQLRGENRIIQHLC